VESWLNELRFAARYLLRRRGATATAVLALGIGVGAATTVFSVLYGVVLRPLPYPDSERIVALFQINARGQRTSTVSAVLLPALHAARVDPAVTLRNE
jgi:putative ABC transport system permease protein